ncbi:42838_t:CDS:2 [Gigaspora margarita]|uniref:42838_t:CDS:1 n=1 Tax=Gigaspora margarita TaxID=4874 RepID=A0ABM8W1F3_GIGMA|nr:42838_t:CDS:2 [Gigaspora margarita]
MRKYLLMRTRKDYLNIHADKLNLIINWLSGHTRSDNITSEDNLKNFLIEHTKSLDKERKNYRALARKCIKRLYGERERLKHENIRLRIENDRLRNNLQSRLNGQIGNLQTEELN